MLRLRKTNCFKAGHKIPQKSAGAKKGNKGVVLFFGTSGLQASYVKHGMHVPIG